MGYRNHGFAHEERLLNNNNKRSSADHFKKQPYGECFQVLQASKKEKRERRDVPTLRSHLICDRTVLPTQRSQVDLCL